MRVLLCAVLLLVTYAHAEQVYVQFGSNLPAAIPSRVAMLLNKAVAPPIIILSASATPLQSLPVGSILLSFGSTSTSAELISIPELQATGAEGFVLKTVITSSGVIGAVGDGNQPDAYFGRSSGGASYASYAILDVLGFAFLHPLAPVIPASLHLPTTNTSVAESAYWPVRGTHYHTEHPLELMEVFNGFGHNNSYEDEAGWEEMFNEIEPFAEWMVANRQNRLEWVLLYAEQWAAFASSVVRQQRFTRIINLFHSYGVLCGADVPIAVRQQHAWYMIEVTGTLDQEQQQIAERIDWLVQAGFDFISSESGSSEFTHPSDDRMLAWMEFAGAYSLSKYNMWFYIKCHCSTGQICKDYKDPRTGQPLNFNFLPMLANSSLGIYPHTVQMYTFDDPAPTYGNTNFTYMLDFMMYEAPSRPTIYHGETAYWVNYDIDVPLFLPLYADARLRDLQQIAGLQSDTRKIQGEVNFNSGWEWGYWLSDVVLARAAWNPYPAQSPEQAMGIILTEVLSVFGDTASQLVAILQQIIASERQLLIYGEVNGTRPDDVIKRNGIAYLEGWDTWGDIGAMLGPGSTQPKRTGPVAIRDPLARPNYNTVQPLLDAMASTFTAQFQQLAALRASVPVETLPLFDDMTDAMQMTALRATQVAALYQYAATWPAGQSASRKAQLAISVQALDTATSVVAKREQQYRVPAERIAGWGPNPTVYTYGYLWTVHSLYYMWRDHDEAMLESTSAISPCYMNIIDPIDVAFGEGVLLNVTEAARRLWEKYQWADFGPDCLAAPINEPHYPCAGDC
eukprot:TRINITY_DN4777_c0_g2_i1.p1 TRINITY_DN4777_c0_g2~~TRINITY_DN4777_c0_g2_i1.p1  ORF type:complete len:794 (-),score=167.73 TRINITY_DN4777_c0_g2_i1:1848-4229(-)